MIMFNTYMTQFTCGKITTYLDAKGTSKNTCFLCEQLTLAKNPDFTRKRLCERVKMFPINLKDW